MNAPLPSQAQNVAYNLTQADLQQWRTQLLNGLLLTIFIVAGPFTVLTAINTLQNVPQYAVFVIAAFITAYSIIAINTFVRKIPYLVRTITLLLVMYGLAVYDVFTYSLVSDGRIYFLSLVVIAALLMGIRSAAVVMGITIITLLVLGAVVHQWVPSTIDTAPHVVLWGTVVFSQVLHAIVLVVCLAFLLRRLVNALSSIRSALQQAETSAEYAQQQAAALATQTQRLEETQAQLQQLISSLETPMVDLADGIVLAPITGRVDTRRVQMIMKRLLQRVHAHGTHFVIVDLAGMPDADPIAIQGLNTMARALQLLGCRVIFTSLSSELAQSFQQSGSTLDTLEFLRSPQEVLASNAFKQL